MMQQPRSSAQSGSVFFLILLGIFLFAAFSYAIMQGSRTSQANLTTEQARIAAQEIIAYADTVSKAVSKLRLAGCSDIQISVDSSLVPAPNPNSPADKSCHIFSSQGGNVTEQQKAQPSFFNQTDIYSGYWAVTATDDIIGIGTNGCSNSSCTDLNIVLLNVKSEICTAINKALGIQTMPTDSDYFWNVLWIGTYASNPNVVGNDTGGLPMRGKGSACLLETGTGKYIFYQILIAR